MVPATSAHLQFANPDILPAKYSFRNEEGNGFELTAGGKFWASGYTYSNISDLEYGDDKYNFDAGVSYYWERGKYGLHFKVNNIFDEQITFYANSQFDLRRAFLSFSGSF